MGNHPGLPGPDFPLTPDFPLSPRVQLMIPETVVAAWPELPEAMPASILAMVKAASLER